MLKRAQYFITCGGRMPEGLKITESGVLNALVSERSASFLPQNRPEQLSLFQPEAVTGEDVKKCLTGQI